MATGIDLSVPLTVPTAAEELKAFTDPDAISNTADPLRRVAMVMVALSTAEGNSLTAEVEDVKLDTASIADTNELMGWVNTASSNATNQPATYKAAIGPPCADATGATALKNRLIAAGVDGTQIEIQGTQVVIAQPNLTGASKNLQLHVDSLSNDTQQKQLFLQTLTGKYNSTFEVATNVLRKRAELQDAINQNVRT